jgi:hypothetical protein
MYAHMITKSLKHYMGIIFILNSKQTMVNYSVTKNGGTLERRRTIMAASNLSPPSRALTDQAQWHLTARTQQDRQPSLVSKLEFITQLQEQSSELSHT